MFSAQSMITLQTRCV